MKSNFFKHFRKKYKWYDVQMTCGIFGEFEDDTKFKQVLAKNHKQAISRAQKRGYYSFTHVSFFGSLKRLARWRVKPSEKTWKSREVKFY